MSSVLPDQGNSLAPNGGTRMVQTAGSKVIRRENLASIGSTATVGPASGSRVYTKDYSKVAPEKYDTDQVGPYLGNPLRW